MKKINSIIGLFSLMLVIELEQDNKISLQYNKVKHQKIK